MVPALVALFFVCLVFIAGAALLAAFAMLDIATSLKSIAGQGEPQTKTGPTIRIAS